jgi:hypothetical protein
LKGNNKETVITLKMAGGKVGEIGAWSEEYQAFSKDEEVLLFLYQNGKNNNYWKISGVSGKLSIIEKDGIKYYDGKMLKEDEDTKSIVYPLLQCNDVKNKIANYLLKG